MIRICYIILVHRNLQQVIELIDLLAGDCVGFIVHVDSKCNEVISVLSTIRDVALADKRHDVLWGDISMVDTAIQSLTDTRHFDYFFLISGQDIPVKPAGYISEYIRGKFLQISLAQFLSPRRNAHGLKGDGGASIVMP